MIHERISIHALREEGDAAKGNHQISQNISIHALREEGDEFLLCPVNSHQYFYPRPPRGGRPKDNERQTKDKYISIHALREEGDVAQTAPELTALIFLSTPSARRATGGGDGCSFHIANFYPRPPRGGRPFLAHV